MLHTQTVETRTLDLIKELMADSQLSSFNLVGGTALALKLGHRISIDIDLFSTTAFPSKELASYLIGKYDAADVRILTNGIFCFIKDIKVDLLAHQYPLIGDLDVVEGIRLVSLEDIGAMKLNAIYNSGRRLKDFVDMYRLLEKLTLDQMLQACNKKYPDINIHMVKNSVIHHQDIDFSVPIEHVGPEIKWTAIAERLQKAFYNPHITFNLPEITKKLMQKKDDNNKKRRRL
jgi:hypothetical protein